MPSQVNGSLPKGIDEVFDKMTRDDRAERYTSVDQIFEDIEKLDGVKSFVEGNHAALFSVNPIASLKFRIPAPAVEVPSKVAADVPASGPIAAVEDRSRDALARRPYSVQQRMKNKPET
jgi:hypothetical protein